METTFFSELATQFGAWLAGCWLVGGHRWDTVGARPVSATSLEPQQLLEMCLSQNLLEPGRDLVHSSLVAQAMQNLGM